MHHVTPSYIVNTNPTYSLQLTHLLMFTVEGLRVPAMWCPDQVIPMIYTPALEKRMHAISLADLFIIFESFTGPDTQCMRSYYFSLSLAALSCMYFSKILEDA